MTMRSPETHYGCGTVGYKIMVSPGTGFSPEAHFGNVNPAVL